MGSFDRVYRLHLTRKQRREKVPARHKYNTFLFLPMSMSVMLLFLFFLFLSCSVVNVSEVGLASI
jgi:hypothetical protein